MEFTNDEIAAMIQATEAGTEWAKSLKVGDHFTGARPVAVSRFQSERERRLFVYSAVTVLETLRLVTDGERGFIMEIGPRK